MNTSLAEKIKARQDAQKIIKPVESKSIIDTAIDVQSDPNDRNLLIAQIEVDTQVRTDFDGIEDLADSIKNGVLIQPVSVIQLSPDRYKLLSGERRFRAFRDILKRDLIPAHVIDVSHVVMPGVDNVDSIVSILRLTENTNRANLLPFETANGLLDIKKDTGLTNKVIGQYVGMSEGYIAKYLRLFDAPDIIKKALQNKEISVTQWFNKQQEVLIEYGLAEEENNESSPGNADNSEKGSDKRKSKTVAIDYEAGLVVAKLLKKLCEQNSLLPIEYDLSGGEITKKELVQLINARTKDIFDQL